MHSPSGELLVDEVSTTGIQRIQRMVLDEGGGGGGVWWTMRERHEHYQLITTPPNFPSAAPDSLA